MYMNIAAIITTIAICLFGFAGGGGSSSGGGGGGGGFSSSSSSSSSYYSSSSSSSGSYYDDPVEALISSAITFIILGVIIATFYIIGNKPSFRDCNSTPEEKWIHKEAKRIFESYQKDWTDFNYDGIKTYTTEHYYTHASLMLDLLKNLHRVNKISKLKVHKVYLSTPVSEHSTLPANLIINFYFSGLDEVYDTTDNKKLYSNHATRVIETWNFIYDGKTLKLSGISQPTESAPHLFRSLASFADENNLFYSPDWGRYALPSRGMIFGGATMSVADINNHVIGKWGDLLIQLYTYAESPGRATNTYYVVGQINVPKEYLGVVVKSRKFTAGKKPDKSYDKFEMEWNEFNNRYEVYAASRDALPAFELLNPKFMEYLYDKNPAYNLEVVDNIIYIYAPISTVTENDYNDLLEVLKKAYDELKM